MWERLKPAQAQNGEKSILNWADKSGEFKRQQSAFRSWISSKPGAEFPPEKDRYHLCELVVHLNELH